MLFNLFIFVHDDNINVFEGNFSNWIINSHNKFEISLSSLLSFGKISSKFSIIIIEGESNFENKKIDCI